MTEHKTLGYGFKFRVGDKVRETTMNQQHYGTILEILPDDKVRYTWSHWSFNASEIRDINAFRNCELISRKSITIASIFTEKLMAQK